MRTLLFCLFFAISFFGLSQSKIGDNLGNHKAVADLNMNVKKVLNADAVAIGTATMTNSSVQLELGSTSKAILVNRVANTAAIVSPVNGMLIYNNSDNRFYLYGSGSWIMIAAMSDFTWANIIGKPSFATVATTGSYTDLINKPVNVSSFTNDAAYLTAASLTWSNISSKPSFATVATTGSYNDLSSKPSIPSTTSGLTNDAGFITTNGRAYPRRSDGTNIDFIWSGQGGQPSWLYGSNDGVNNYVWNPSNFSVAYATNSGNSSTTSQRTFGYLRSDGINRGSYGTVSIAGTNNGWGGIDFTDQSLTLMTRNDGYSGMYKNNNTWTWSFDGNGLLQNGTVPWSSIVSKPSFDYATHRGEGTNFIDYSRYVYNNAAYSGSGWVEPSDLGVRYASSAGSATNATNASNSRYVYNNGTYGGTVGYIEPSSMQVYYANLGRYVYNNGAYSGSGWVEPSDLGVRYASSAGSAGYVDWNSVGNRPTNVSSFNNDAGYTPVNGTNYWGGTNYFYSNKGGYYLSQTNTAGLEAFSSDGTSAFMSFHRSGDFAINMGLDPDHVFRWGGWSLGATNIMELSMSGDLSIPGIMYLQNLSFISDRKFKNIFKWSQVAAPKNVLSIKLKPYNFKSDSTAALHFGYIAQEVEEVFPTAVTNVKKLKPIDKSAQKLLGNKYQEAQYDEHKEVNYIEVHSLMINELVEQINALKKEIELLKAENRRGKGNK